MSKQIPKTPTQPQRHQSLNPTGKKTPKTNNMNSISSLKLEEESHIFRSNQSKNNVYEGLKTAFKTSVDQIIQDPLMQCFKENPESEVFMLDRIDEIINENIQRIIQNDKSHSSEQFGELMKINENLKMDLEELANFNTELKGENIQLKQEMDNRNNQKEFSKKYQELENEVSLAQNHIESCYQKIKEKDSQIEELLELVQKQKLTLKNSENEENKTFKNTESLKFLLEEQKSSLNGYEEEMKKNFRMMEEKEEEILVLRKNLKSAQSQIRKSKLFRDDIKKDQIRKIKELQDEVEMYKKSMKDLNFLLDKHSNFEDKETSKITNLEMDIKKMSDLIKEKDSEIEQAKFNFEELERLKNGLKEQVKELTSKLGHLQKEKSDVEIRQKTLNQRVSDLKINDAILKEQLKKNQQVLDFTQKRLNETQNELKIQRRKSCGLERETDQIKFSLKTNELELAQITESLKDQIQKLKSDKTNQSLRLQSSLEEIQKKLESERQQHIRTKNRLEMVEESEEKLKILNENLSKKVEFFKTQTLSSKPSKSVIESEEKNRKKLMRDLLKKSRENTKLKSLISQIRNKLKSFILQFSREKNQLKKQVDFLRSGVNSVFNSIASRLKEESRKRYYKERDLERLKKDLNYFEKYSNYSYKKSLQSSVISKKSQLGRFDSEVKNCFLKEKIEKFEDRLKKSPVRKSELNVVKIQNIGLESLEKKENKRKNRVDETLPISDFNDDITNFYLSNSETGSIYNPQNENDKTIDSIVFSNKKNISIHEKSVDYEKIEQESMEIEKRISMLKKKGSVLNQTRTKKYHKSEEYQKALRSARELVRKKELKMKEYGEITEKRMIGMVISPLDKENEARRANDSFVGQQQDYLKIE